METNDKKIHGNSGKQRTPEQIKSLSDSHKNPWSEKRRKAYERSNNLGKNSKRTDWDSWKNRRAKTAEEYLQSRIKEIDENGCWVSSGNYSSFDGESIPIHRMSYEHFVGEIPDGMIIRHKCDNGVCINPSHLEIGTTKDNYRDFMERNTDKYEATIKKARSLSPFGKPEFVASYSGKNHRDATKVICLSDGRIFETIREAAKFYSIFESGISAVCRGKRKTCGGLSFAYAEKENEQWQP